MPELLTTSDNPYSIGIYNIDSSRKYQKYQVDIVQYIILWVLLNSICYMWHVISVLVDIFRHLKIPYYIPNTYQYWLIIKPKVLNLVTPISVFPILPIFHQCNVSSSNIVIILQYNVNISNIMSDIANF